MTLPVDTDNVTLTVSQREVRLTNLRKPFWPALGITKGGLIQYYADVASVLLPHIEDRPMVMTSSFGMAPALPCGVRRIACAVCRA